MKASELRERYQHFFEARGHRRTRSAPLLPENDSTVLFTTAGMHPLVPFLLGETHPRRNGSLPSTPTNARAQRGRLQRRVRRHAPRRERGAAHLAPVAPRATGRRHLLGR